MESRHHVYINNPEANKKEAHCDNFIKTTKYTWWNFLFKNLFYQYHNVSTIFFTLNMIIALIPGVSPLLPITTVLPLFAILSVSAFREGLEDYSRYRNDLSANRKPVFILRNSRKVKLRAQDIHTGDFFYLHRNELVPCDCLLLATNDREGVVYVDTANLDGETNLKPKDCHMDLKARYDCLLNIDSEGSLLASEDPKGRIEMPKPDGNTHECHGRIYFENATTTIRFNLKNILLRGSTLRNCDVAALLAVHTGSQTKISLNVKESVVKQSRIDLKLNYIVRIIFVWHQVLVFSISGVSILFRKNYLMKFFSGMDSSISRSITSYLVDKNVTFFFGRSYATYYVLLSAMIPISLFVTVEFCKAIQARFMEWDVLMHSKEGKMHANSYALHEELSQIQCVFTDKTGTLTKNHMLYAGCWLPGGYSYDEILSPKSLLKRWQSSKCTRDERQEIELFLKCLTICNTVIVLNDESGNILYDGSSPDEVALVRGALNNGFKLTVRSSDTVSYLKELDRVGRACSEKVLCVLPFSSHRKMMSIVVEHANNELILYTKGADSSIIPRLFDTSPKAVIPVTIAISEFSQKGLRTLVWAYRPLTRHEFEDWFRQWEDIAINTKSPRSRESSIDEACLKLEKKMMLVGCSAIEDELQEGVVQTIQFLINAKIRVWMLTGDKRETAVNIAVRSAIVNLDHDTLFGLETTQLSGDHLLGAILSATERARTLRALNKNACAIVEGSDLMVVEGLSICFLHFKRLLFLMNSTICCRLTPKQKANMVAAFQEEGFTALAIGDGANDISMIREARVGVAVIGMEGSQATRSCDYVIPRFRHLTRLMAVHGRYCLLRNSALIQYSLYKNMLIAFVQTFYAFFNGYSGYSLHDSWLLMLYNLVFTALPPLAMGLLDFDIRDEALLNHPELYSELRKPLVMRLSSITTVLWIIAAFAQSSVLFFTHIPYMLSDEGGSVTIAGTLQMTGAILYILTQAAVVYPSWTVFHFFAIILSVIAFLLFVFVYPHLAALFWLTDYMGAAQRMLFQCSTYIHLIFWFFVVLSYEIAFLALFRGRYKGPTHSIHAKYAQNRFMQSLRDFVHDWQGSNKHSDDDIAQLRWDNLEQTESLLIENAWDHSSLLPSYSLELNVEPSVMMMDDNQDQVCLTENQSSSPFLNIELL